MSWPPRNKAAENIRNPADVFPIAGEWAADSRPDPDPLAALSDPDSCPDPDPIRRPLRSRFASRWRSDWRCFAVPMMPPIGCPEVRRCVVQGCLGGRIAAPGGGFAGLMFFAVPSAPGGGDTSSPIGELVSSLGV